MNKYGLGEILKNIKSMVYTKIFFKRARLIRMPFYLRGKKHLFYGSGFTTGYGCRIELFNINGTDNIKLQIGNNCKMGDHVHIAAGEKVYIGNNCLMASRIYISDISHGDYKSDNNQSNPMEAPKDRKLKTTPVIIGDNVWIGEGVSILPGVIIGNGSVIGANSVVTKQIPDNSIVVGVPGKVIKLYDPYTKCWIKT